MNTFSMERKVKSNYLCMTVQENRATGKRRLKGFFMSNEKLKDPKYITGCVFIQIIKGRYLMNKVIQ